MKAENTNVEVEGPMLVQLADPDWTLVKGLAAQAAELTAEGKMTQANDIYQSLAIEAMHTLYGPNAIVNFIQYAMEQEAKKQVSRIQTLGEYRFKA
jgi:hypothetical protein